MQKIIIIGAGLSGLALAYFLKKEGIETFLLEARPRPGGRINTTTGNNGTPLEMGATSFGMKHRHLVGLLRELGLEFFPQYTEGIGVFETFSFEPPQQFSIPPAESPSYRIRGGTSSLIRRLLEDLDEKNIHYGTPVTSIVFEKNNFLLTDKNGYTWASDLVVSTLPPKLLADTVNIRPVLPAEVRQLCTNTHTWMGESIKFAVEYATPFWRQKGFAGAAFSQSSIANEIHDHTNFEENAFALKGFLVGGAARLTPAERQQALIAQLIKFFGPEAAHFVSYHESVWAHEPFTSTPPDGTWLRPHQNSGHPLFRQAFFDGRFFIAGSETASDFGGYMDGAVQSAVEVFREIAKMVL